MSQDKALEKLKAQISIYRNKQTGRLTIDVDTEGIDGDDADDAGVPRITLRVNEFSVDVEDISE
ncbi:MAG: hypothetical protein ABW123_22845 [Cystobacter sp.]